MKPRAHESRRCRSASFQARRCVADERGSAAIELVLLVPALMLMLLFAVAGGRVAIAHGSVQQAAADAARAASIARTRRRPDVGGHGGTRHPGKPGADVRVDDGDPRHLGLRHPGGHPRQR